MQLAGGKSLEQQLKVLAGDAWQQELTSEQGRPAGSPSVLLMSASAAVANDLIKLLPAFNQVTIHSRPYLVTLYTSLHRICPKAFDQDRWQSVKPLGC